VAGLDLSEIQALARIMDELNYYQILHLERGASATVIKQAYFASSRSFHPDANRHLDEKHRDDCASISKRVTEAYCVLRDPRRRKSYDKQLGEGNLGGGGFRMALAEAKAAHAKSESEARQGRTPQGRQYFQKATEDLARGDENAAVRNLQMALTFESDNSFFRAKLDELRPPKKKKKKV
jgi:DnaJ-class molecular chaperone